MNGVYWGLTALALMNRQDALPRDEMIQWVMSCYVPSVGESFFPSYGARGVKCTESSPRESATVRLPLGAFSPYPNHDPNVHTTLSAVQILAMQDSLDSLDREKIVNCTRSFLPIRSGIPTRVAG